MRILGEFGYSLFLIVSGFIALTIIYRRQWPAILQIVIWTASISACIAALLFRGFVGVGIDDVVAKYVTSAICGIYHVPWCKDAEPAATNRPKRITTDVRKLEFFDPATGHPRVLVFKDEQRKLRAVRRWWLSPSDQ